MNEIIELLKTAVAEILNETEPKDLSKNPEKSLDIKDNANPNFTPLCLRKNQFMGGKK